MTGSRFEHVEHDHELHDVYRLYLETFEKKIEKRHRRGGLSSARRCSSGRAADAGKRRGVRQPRFFFEALLPRTSAYSSMSALMMTEARRVKDKGLKAFRDTIDEDEEQELVNGGSTSRNVRHMERPRSLGLLPVATGNPDLSFFLCVSNPFCRSRVSDN